MMQASKKGNNKVNKENAQENTVQDELEDFNAALSASLDSLYENDFDNKKSAEEEANEEKIRAEFPTIEAPSPEAFAEEESIPASEEEPGDVTNIDEDVFKDINSALAQQIESEMRREKRRERKNRRRSWWWLLSLIPVLGIFVLFIRPLRKNMPKWFMTLRALVFVAFAAVTMAVVATNGTFAYKYIAKYCVKNSGKALEKELDFSREAKAADETGEAENSGETAVTETEESAETAAAEKLTFLLVQEDTSSDRIYLDIVSIDTGSGDTAIKVTGKALGVTPSETLESLVKKGKLGTCCDYLEKYFETDISYIVYCDAEAMSVFDEKTGGLGLKQLAANSSDADVLAYRARQLTAVYKKLTDSNHFVLLKGIVPALKYVKTDMTEEELAEVLDTLAGLELKAPEYEFTEE